MYEFPKPNAFFVRTKSAHLCWPRRIVLISLKARNGVALTVKFGELIKGGGEDVHQDNHNAFAQAVKIRSSSSFLSINSDNSSALQMLTSDDVRAMHFGSYEAGESFYQKYASAVGFIVRKDDIGRNKQGEVVMRKWVCNREGYRQRKYLENANQRREPRPSTRVNCPATFRISLDRATRKWVVKDFPSLLMNYLVKQVGDYNPVVTEDQDLNNPTKT
ncbi:hypothetical protein L6164_010829 [Bauhinia variegata]|uniref:Uncharacterized protein n=1 Tax=Bauhinia variegata TaxID=167791 RepID=A0ACB9P4R2_BAUVA|nr:hypothetical protein L6164_010829 [Bauhinia variegata]